MLAHPPRVAPCQSFVDLVVHNSSGPRALNSVGTVQLGKNPTRRGRDGFARACRLRCRRSSSSTKHVERLAAGRGGGGKDSHNELRSCRVAPISAAEVEGSSAVESGSHSPAFDVETAHHESPAAALISSGAEAATQDGEWQSFGRDGGVERLSTSSSYRGGSVPVAFKNSSLGNISFGTAGLETIQNVEWPVGDDGGTAAEEGLGLRNGEGLHNLRIIQHPKTNNATEAQEDEEERHILVSAQEGLTELPVELPEIKKRTSLGVRKPSQEPLAEIDPVPNARQVNIAGRQDERPEPQPEPELQEDFEYYIPKVGDEVTGVVVSGTEYQLDIEIGAKQLGRMLSKDLKPLDVFRADELFWALDESGSSMPATSLGQFRFLGDRELLRPTYPLVPVGTVLTLEVLGVTLSGRAVLSARKIASRIAWHRVRQIHEQNEPIEAQCVAWNSDGLVFKIEGLRAILPLNEFLNRSKGLVSLEEHVGEWKNVLITNVEEAPRKLLVSEKRAWSRRNLRIGSLVVGTVQRILPFGVEVSLDGTSLRLKFRVPFKDQTQEFERAGPWAMLHISHISRCYIPDIMSVFTAGEKVKALVINSGNPHRIGLSTAYLESSQGLMLQDKKRVFREAEEMAARQQRPLSEAESNEYGKDVDTEKKIEDPCPANQDWLDFGEGEISMLYSSQNEQ